ncbi:hypothetical protein Misp06_01078 [Microbulbifer sp. NBRC 101763]
MIIIKSYHKNIPKKNLEKNNIPSKNKSFPTEKNSNEDRKSSRQQKPNKSDNPTPE